MKYQIALNESNQLGLLVQVLGEAASIPGGYTKIGEFDHPDLNEHLGWVDSHVIFQHVQEAMYLKGYLDMQIVHITWPGKVVATAVTIADQTINAGLTKQLAATTTPAAVSNGRLKWGTFDGKLARITAQGLLMAFAPGVQRAWVKAVDGGAYHEFNINIAAAGTVAVASVSVAPGATSKAVGQTQQYTATVLPANATNKTLVWTSSDPTKATVSATGLATAVAEGTSTITATTVDGAKVGTSVLTVTA